MLNPVVIKQLALWIPAMLLSLSVHEFSHAFVATRLGDTTPVRQGRLTLSPLSHIDLFGTILLPTMLVLAGAPAFGWAKPVQFQPANFTRRVSMWQGTALAAAAGPVSNLVLAFLAALSIRIMDAAGVPVVGLIGAPTLQDPFANTMAMAVNFILVFFHLNVLLAVFNLVPLPPLDGSHFIPRSLGDFKELLTRYSFILFLLLFMIPINGRTLGRAILDPVQDFVSTIILKVVGVI